MGCHTWCYNEVDMDTIQLSMLKEEILKSTITTIKYIEEDILEMLNGTGANHFNNTDDKSNSIKEYNIDLNSIKEHNLDLKYYKNIIQRINSGELDKKRKLLKLYVQTFHGKNFSIFENKLYIKTEYHDLFRTNYDDETLLHNLDETMDYIKDKKCCGNSYFSEKVGEIITEEININHIKRFWNDNPKGIIEFG